MCTEGTYPYVGGGVSTWCNILCEELAEVDFTVYAVTGAPEVQARFDLPRNVTGVVHVPLWGGQEPWEYVLTEVPMAEIRRRRAATGHKTVEEQFIPLLRQLLSGMQRETVDERDGDVLLELWRFFQDHDWRLAWKSRAAWDAFLEEVLPRYEGDLLPGEAPTVDDLTTALRWLYNYLLPLVLPLQRTDLVHTSIAGFAGIPGIIAKLEHGTPFLVTEHGVWVRERYIAISAGAFTTFAKRFLMQLSSYIARLNYLVADIVSPVTDFNRRWELPYGVDVGRTLSIYNGVDQGVFLPRPKPAHTAGRPTVVAAARIFPLKDIETMIRAAAVARELVPDVQFLVYGSLDADIPYVERCQALVAELGLEETFELAGHHSKPAELFAEGDISALSSISEAFPYTVLESMACGRPVVGTDVGGVREAIEGFGIVVAPRDPEAFGQAVAQLLTDDLLRIELGRRGRERVLSSYRTAYSIRGYRDVYAQLTSHSTVAAAE